MQNLKNIACAVFLRWASWATAYAVVFIAKIPSANIPTTARRCSSWLRTQVGQPQDSPLSNRFLTGRWIVVFSGKTLTPALPKREQASTGCASLLNS